MDKPRRSRILWGTLLVLAGLTAPSAQATQGQISTFVGGSSGEGMLATQIAVASPMGLAMDGENNLYFAERDGHRVRKVNTAGVITTIAGSGPAGLSGDGGPATSARLNGPTSVAVDGVGNLFISDSGNNRIRRVTPGGTISTFVGASCYSDRFCSIRDNGPATEGGLSSPRGISIVGSDLLIADTYNSRIRRVRDGIITTIIGSGERGLAGDGGPAILAKINWPFDVTADPLGNVFLADQQNFRVRKVDSQGIITTVVGGGLLGSSPIAPSASSGTGAEGVTADAQGVVYITEPNRVRKLESGLIQTVAGGTFGLRLQICQSYPADPTCPQLTVEPTGDGGPALAARLSSPADVLPMPGGGLIVADSGNHRIRRIDGNGVISTIVGNGSARYWGDGGPAEQASLSGARDVAFDAAGNLFICDTDNHRIRKVTPDGDISTYAESREGEIYIDGARVASGSFAPSSIAIDANGNKFISDAVRHQILMVTPADAMIVLAGTGRPGYTDGLGPSAAFRSPRGVAVDPSGNLLVADTGNHSIRKITIMGYVSTLVGDGTPGGTRDGDYPWGARLSSPEDIAVDSHGRILIADTGNHAVFSVFQGVIRRVAGQQYTGGFNAYPQGGFYGDGGPATSALLSAPRGVSVDYTGTIFISDTGNQRVRRVDYLGIINTVAGNGAQGFSGDGGAATSASLNLPIGLALNDQTDLYIADVGNSRVRKVGPTF